MANLEMHTEICLGLLIWGPVPTKDMQTPPLLRNGHLDIRDVQCAGNIDGHKMSYHTISCLDARDVQKERLGR